MYINTVNWDSIKTQVYLKSAQAKTVEALKPAFETLLNGLRDHHGKILNAKDDSYLAWFTDNKNKRYQDKRIYDPEVWKIVNDTALKFEYQILNDRIGYLKIVGIKPNVDIEFESKKIRAAIDSIYKKQVMHWIIDLRYNTGGNMNPMMAGLAPLIGVGHVGSVVNLKHEKLFDWEIKNGNFIYDGVQAVTLPPYPSFIVAPKVAVLTSRFTVSSGEIVATAFKGRTQTKFFGETTGGYTTNDSWEVINNEIILAISTGVYCDRKGVVYQNNIPADVEIPFEIIKDIKHDNCINAAIKWLDEK